MRRSHQSGKGRNFLLLHQSRRETSLNLHTIPGVRSQSLDLDCILQSERGASEADQNLQEGVIGANIDVGPGGIPT